MTACRLCLSQTQWLLLLFSHWEKLLNGIGLLRPPVLLSTCLSLVGFRIENLQRGRNIPIYKSISLILPVVPLWHVGLWGESDALQGQTGRVLNPGHDGTCASPSPGISIM